MAKDLYIIVHEILVGIDTLVGRPESIAVLAEIQNLKKTNPTLSIEGAPSELHPEMPPASLDFPVWVCGAYKQHCVASQLLSLKSAGYNARFHHPACLAGSQEMKGEVLNYLLQRYPDFFE